MCYFSVVCLLPKIIIGVLSMNKNTMSSLSKTEVGIARLTYEERYCNCEELDSYLPADFSYRNQLVYSLRKADSDSIKAGFICLYLWKLFDGRQVGGFLSQPFSFPKRLLSKLFSIFVL